ncbi:MAG: cytochrome c [Planctomycetaceae bacterium]|nr:cytochrome c [Planctomycetaceae bacterium]
MTRAKLTIGCLLCAGLTGCGGRAQPAPEATTAAEAPAPAVVETSPTIEATRPAPPVVTPEKLPVEHLPNAYRITSMVISGGLPDGEAGFQELEDLGVKTVISVDGMEPDVETARLHGMRYVHLPHGYDGVPSQRGHELAKALRELPGPIYIHCHHGKHRSPAATAVACVEAGLISQESAEIILKTAGTGENYQGLYRSARDAGALDSAFLDGLKVEFVEVATIPPLADAMVALEHTHDHIKQIAAAEWQAPTKHPDLQPAHEALLLKEHFAEMLRMDAVAIKPEPFREYLRTSETAAQDLETALTQSPPALDAAKTALDTVNANCAACHREFRDNATVQSAH